MGDICFTVEKGKVFQGLSMGAVRYVLAMKAKAQRTRGGLGELGAFALESALRAGLEAAGPAGSFVQRATPLAVVEAVFRAAAQGRSNVLTPLATRFGGSLEAVLRELQQSTGLVRVGSRAGTTHVVVEVHKLLGMEPPVAPQTLGSIQQHSSASSLGGPSAMQLPVPLPVALPAPSATLRGSSGCNSSSSSSAALGPAGPSICTATAAISGQDPSRPVIVTTLAQAQEAVAWLRQQPAVAADSGERRLLDLGLLPKCSM